MNLTRREFLKESLATLGFLALPGGLFSAPAGWKPKKKPNLVFGILSDTHLQSGWDGVTPHGGFPLTYVKNVPAIPVMRVTIPPADGNPISRPYAYDVVVMGDDLKDRLFKHIYWPGCNLGVGHEPDGGVTTLDIPKSELPAGKKLTIAVRPVSSLGTKGKSVSTTFRV